MAPLNTLQSQSQAQGTEGYILRHISVSCPECQCSFTAPSLVEIPAVTEYDRIEADLHRVLPDADLRGALIAVCPHCNFATWTVRFAVSTLNPEMLPDAEEVANTKKFALAVKHAREKGVSPLDIAFIAINGFYCARETGEDADLWLELAAYEQSRGIAEESIIPATGQDFLIMAELWRQLGSFENALGALERAVEDEFIPRELVNELVNQCRAENSNPIVLPPHMVRAIFPQAQEMTARVPIAKTGRPVPPFIERRPKSDRLEMATWGPPERREALSSAVVDEPLPVGLSPEVEDHDAPIELTVSTEPAAAPGIGAAQETAAAAAKTTEEIPVNKVRQIIAQPQGASAVYLVQAAQMPQGSGNAGAANANGAAPNGAAANANGAAANANTAAANGAAANANTAAANGAAANANGATASANGNNYAPNGAAANATGANANTYAANANAGADSYANQNANGYANNANAYNPPAAPSNAQYSDSHAQPATPTRGAGRHGRGKKPKQSQPTPNPLPNIEMPTNEYFAGASSPNGDPSGAPKEKPVTPMQRAINKAMGKDKKQGDAFPDIQLTDEYADEMYEQQYEDYDDESGAAAPSDEDAAAAAAASGGNGDFTSAIAQVESFLNLRRQPSYQNWIRTHKQ